MSNADRLTSSAAFFSNSRNLDVDSIAIACMNSIVIIIIMQQKKRSNKLPESVFIR